MTTYCVNHHGLETALRCGKCDRPICGRCVMFTPVGTRCRECARLTRVPTYAVGPVYLLRGLAAGLGAGVGVGLLSGFLLRLGVLPAAWFLGPLALLACGYAAGEAVSLATNRKRGPVLQAVGIGSFVAGYLALELLTPWLIIYSLWSIVAAIVAVALIVGRLR